MSEQETIRVDQISRVLAVLIAENEEYSYVDKLGYVVSPDLAVYYLREALRDYSSLTTKTKWDNPRAREEANKIKMEYVEKEIQDIARINDPKEIRKIVSLIAARALARANYLRGGGEK
ncbi:MAG: type I-A CRISPR-associated protein Csa5 [Desulfurococcales archaeon ex4484_58]|nr:MAG: type I-A CRISPR-associated protein Csa5 [Desulfurococcales archaeon ex4484_58]